MSANPNEAALRKLLDEIQGKLQDTNRQLVQVRTQIQVKERERKVAEIQARELNAAGADISTYLSVGKMFLQMPQSKILEDLDNKMASLQDDIQVLGKKQTYLEKSRESCTNALQEAVKQAARA